MNEGEKDAAKVRAAKARAESLTPEDRKEIGRKGGTTRWDKEKGIPRAEYSGELRIGDMVFPCSVLSDGTRILTQSDFMSGMNMYYSGWVSKNRPDEDAADVPLFLAFKSLKPFVDKHLGDLQSITVAYRTERGTIARGIKAEIIPKLCDVWLDAEEKGGLGKRQKQIAAKARLLMRALAHTGIIALVDEVTGYQAHRTKDALTLILEEFIAKELQPYVRGTFPPEYYQEIYRLRGLDYPQDSVKRPQYFGSITNDIVYKRLAPGVLEELKRVTPRLSSGRHKNKLFQRLTQNKGYPKLTSHLGAVVTMMQLSGDWHDFVAKLDKFKPRLDIKSLEKGQQLSFDYDARKDSGVGL